MRNLLTAKKICIYRNVLTNQSKKNQQQSTEILLYSMRARSRLKLTWLELFLLDFKSTWFFFY